MTSLGAANSSAAADFYKCFRFKFCIPLCVSPPCEEIKTPTFAVCGGFPPLPRGLGARRRLGTTLEVESNLLALELHCEGDVNMRSLISTPIVKDLAQQAP